MKFVNVDILSTLHDIMLKNTESYRSDFELDKIVIKKYAKSNKSEDKTLLWLSRRCGTYTFRERDVFIYDTPQYITWEYYGEHEYEHVIAYAVELTGIDQNGRICGNIYELDYPEHIKHVAKEAVRGDTVVIHYEKGDRIQSVKKRVYGWPDPELGEFVFFEVIPSEPEKLEVVLAKEKLARSRAKEADFGKYISKLNVRACESA